MTTAAKSYETGFRAFRQAIASRMACKRIANLNRAAIAYQAAGLPEVAAKMERLASLDNAGFREALKG